MPKKIRFIRRWLAILILLSIVCTVPLNEAANAQFPKFYACIMNDTSVTIYYSTLWCTRAGAHSTGYKNYAVPPNEIMIHWGPEGFGRMDIKIHTGGKWGIWKEYTVFGTPGACDLTSTGVLRYNDRGFLRLYLP
jgi:hypothetical protein